MNVLEKILEEIIDELKEDGVIADNERGHRAVEIICSHVDEADKKEFEFDFNRVESFDCQCGRRYVNTYNGGWIPVEERLPEEKTEVLCCFENGTVQSLWQNWKNDGLGDYLDDDLMPTELIAWQPLPEPYRQKEKNNE